MRRFKLGNKTNTTLNKYILAIRALEYGAYAKTVQLDGCEDNYVLRLSKIKAPTAGEPYLS